MTSVEVVALTKVERPLRDLFPASKEASALLVAILVRSDEIVHMIKWMDRASAEESARAALGDARAVLDHTILGRMLLISLADGMEKLRLFKNLPQIQQSLTDLGPRGREFNNHIKSLSKKVEHLTGARNRLAAHLDCEPIAAALRALPAGEHGVLWLAKDRRLESQYDAAHDVVMRAWAADGASVSGDTLADFESTVAAAVAAQVAFVDAARAALHLFAAAL